MSMLVCVGLGYSATAVAARMAAAGWRIGATGRTTEGAARVRALGYEAAVIDDAAGAPALARPAGAFHAAMTHLLVSAAPDAGGDPLLRLHRADLAAAPALRWIGYLSTVGVYGDHGGAWVDEDTPPRPLSERSRRRVAAEQAWMDFARERRSALDIFRLAGIYGPGRSAVDDVADGTARRIVKPGQVFNRIHVADIGRVVAAAIGRAERAAPVADPVAIYNVTDDEPGPAPDVVAYAAALLGRPVPPAIAVEDAGLSPMGLSFYGENKRVSNRRLHERLGVTLEYPTYREGMAAIARARR